MSEVLLEREVERRSPLPHLECRERVDVNLRDCLLDRPHHVGVVVPRERGMDPALEAHLRRPAIPCLLGAADDLLARDEVWRAAEVRRELALRERAEAAAEVAHVRVLDVPRHDVGDLVAADLASQRVGRREHARRLLPACLQEPRDLVLAELGTAELERRCVAADDERHAERLAGRPRVVAREPARVGRSEHERQHGRIEPPRADVLGVDGQPRRQLEPTRARRLGEPLELGPGRLRIHVVDRHGRDAAPVVDARVEETREVVEREVRRRLHVPPGAEQDARDRDRPEVVVERRLLVRGHPRARLRTEVLDDDLLEVPVLLAECFQCEESVDPLCARFADPDEDPARERDRELAREADRLETSRRDLVG